MSHMNLKAGALDRQDKNGLQTSTIFVQNIELFFITPSHLNCALITYWFKAGWWLGGGGRGVVNTCFFANAKMILYILETSVSCSVTIKHCTFLYCLSITDFFNDDMSDDKIKQAMQLP